MLLLFGDHTCASCFVVSVDASTVNYVMRLISRCIYCCSKNPSFVILDQLGGSIESPIKGHFHSAHLKKE